MLVGWLTTQADAIYLVDLLSTIPEDMEILDETLRTWSWSDAPFKHGGWGKIINGITILWGASMLVNFLWPSPADSAFAENFTLRVFSNPSAVQTDYLVAGEQLVNFFGIDFLNRIPVIELIMIVVVLIGGIYFTAQAKKPYVPVVPATATA